MEIRTLKAGAEVVLRRIDQYGRYEFSRKKVYRIAGHVAQLGDRFFAVHRETGLETGKLKGPALSKWEAFPVEPGIVDQERRWYEGVLPPAITPQRVRLIRALERLREQTPEEIETGFDPAVADALVAAAGRPDDYRDDDWTTDGRI